MNKDEIRAAREALGLSTAQFADRLGIASGRTVRRWESGELRPRETVAKLVRRLVAERELAAIEDAAE